MAVVSERSGRGQLAPVARGATLALEAERRAAVRAPLTLRVEVRRTPDGPPVARVWSVDVSLGGLLLSGGAPVLDGERVWLTIGLGDGTRLSAGARVVRRTRGGRVAVALDELGPRDRARLATRLTARS